MKEEEINKDSCRQCNGADWYSGSEAGHDCDGTEQGCQQNCPIENEIQIECKECEGKLTPIKK